MGVCACMHVRVRVRVCACVRACARIYAHTCTQVHAHIPGKNTHTYAHIFTDKNTHTYKRIYTHIYTHTRQKHSQKNDRFDEVKGSRNRCKSNSKKSKIPEFLPSLFFSKVNPCDEVKRPRNVCASTQSPKLPQIFCKIQKRSNFISWIRSKGRGTVSKQFATKFTNFRHCSHQVRDNPKKVISPMR